MKSAQRVPPPPPPLRQQLTSDCHYRLRSLKLKHGGASCSSVSRAELSHVLLTAFLSQFYSWCLLSFFLPSLFCCLPTFTLSSIFFFFSPLIFAFFFSFLFFSFLFFSFHYHSFSPFFLFLRYVSIVSLVSLIVRPSFCYLPASPTLHSIRHFITAMRVLLISSPPHFRARPPSGGNRSKQPPLTNTRPGGGGEAVGIV
jgi:hypothetical protein